MSNTHLFTDFGFFTNKELFPIGSVTSIILAFSVQNSIMEKSYRKQRKTSRRKENFQTGYIYSDWLQYICYLSVYIHEYILIYAIYNATCGIYSDGWIRIYTDLQKFYDAQNLSTIISYGIYDTPVGRDPSFYRSIGRVIYAKMNICQHWHCILQIYMHSRQSSEFTRV